MVANLEVLLWGGDPTPPLDTSRRFGPTIPHSRSSSPPSQPIGVQWMPKELIVFFGRVSEDADTWTSMVLNYFTFMQVSPPQEVAYAATLLQEAAHDWWTAYLQ